MKSTAVIAAFIGTALSSPVSSVAADGTPTPTELQEGNYWIRAVAAPNFHKYLQTNPANEAGVAILESSQTAGQFQVEDGQLVNKVSDPPLYLWIEEPEDKANPPRTLAATFDSEPSPFGTFAWQGDALTWSHPDVNRQNLAAWLVCEDQALFVNTGAYAYDTPAGCADQTVSLGWGLFFGGVVADTIIRSITTTTRLPTTKGLESHGGLVQRRAANGRRLLNLDLDLDRALNFCLSFRLGCRHTSCWESWRVVVWSYGRPKMVHQLKC